jgi:hypothetical protein
MKLSLDLVQWIVGTQVLTQQHFTPPSDPATSDLCALAPEAARAAESGHLLYYIVHNLAARCGVAVPQVGLRGAPGEATSPEDKAHNWSVVKQHLVVLRVPDASRLVDSLGAPGSYTKLLQAVKGRCEALLAEMDAINNTAATASSPTTANDEPGSPVMAEGSVDRVRSRRSKIDDDIARSQEKYMKKKAAEEAARRAEERRQLNAKLLSECVAMSLDVERRRINLAAVGVAPLPVYTEFKNRAVVSLCHSIVEEIVSDVASGAASDRLDVEWDRQQRFRKNQHARREHGTRLMDFAPSVHVEKGTDRRVAMFMKSIVDGIVARCYEPDILDQLAERDAERARERAVVAHLRERLRAEDEARKEEVRVPLKVRMEQEKQRELEREAAERRRREEIADIYRAENREYSQQQAQRKQKKLEAEWAATADEREKQQRAKDELVEHNARSKMITLHNKMRRLIFDMETSERQEVQQDEAAIFKKMQGVATRSRRLIAEAKAAEEEQVVPLSSVSVGTGLLPGYFGESFGSKFLTALELKFLDAVSDMRADPSVGEALLHEARDRYQGQKLNFYNSSAGRMEPLLTVEGVSGCDDALRVVSKQRAVKPARGEPTIGLTLAARQHATDLAYHGIANTVTHVGTDKSSLAQRIAKYGSAAGLGGTGATELVAGVVRHGAHSLAPNDFILFWLLGDGDEARTARDVLFGAGQKYTSCGIGHAVATCEDRVIEVYCLIFANEFADKSVSHMSIAHTAAISGTAAPFLQGDREVHSSVTLRSLFNTTNLNIGRTAQQPDLRMLVQPLRSPRRRLTAADGQPIASMRRPEPAGKPKPAQQPPSGKPQHRPVQTQGSSAPQRRPSHEQSAHDEPAHHRSQKDPAPEFKVDQPPKRLSPIRNRPQPRPAVKQEVDEEEPHPVARAPPARNRSVATPPLPPVRKAPPRAVLRAAACFKILLMRCAQRELVAKRSKLTVPISRHYAAMMVQKTYRRHRCMHRFAVLISDARTVARELETKAVEQERAHASTAISMAGRRYIVQREADHRAAWAASTSVMHVVVSMGAELLLNQRNRVEWQSRCRDYMTRQGGASGEAADAQVKKYVDREDALLRTLVEKYGPDEAHLAEASRLLSGLSLTARREPRDELIAHCGAEADYFCQLDRLRALCVRCVRRWYSVTLRARNRPEYGAALVIQRLYRRTHAAERLDYVENHRDRIRLKCRLERFYRRYNPEKVGEVDALATKYVGAEERLFEALVAKYGPEPLSSG